MQCEGATLPDDVKYCYDFQYNLQDGVSVKTFQEGVPVEVEKGHTLCVFAGDPDSLSPFSYPSSDPANPNYRHFQISGDI
ncbi:MAG: hypothetical protein MJ200_02920 [Mycoplasmoidaceae bacterium]|nr:hypothetical protein [Mycoplasmoidaceae bacterium]